MPSSGCNSIFTEKGVKVIILMPPILCLFYMIYDITSQYATKETATEAVLENPTVTELPSFTLCYPIVQGVKQKLPKDCLNISLSTYCHGIMHLDCRRCLSSIYNDIGYTHLLKNATFNFQDFFKNVLLKMT